MKSYEAGTLIDADPNKVWAVLIDVQAWPAWDSGVLEVEGRGAQGEKIKIVSEANPTRTFSLRVTEVAPPTSMVWAGGMPLGLFRGVRTFKLQPENGATRFHVREDYTGPMVGLIWKSMPDLQPSFDKFVAGLKRRAESAG
jgi:hypothetical protein